jgi:hypothetical protein
MTPDAFIAIASGLAMVKAKTVLGAVRFAVSGKTFATVGWPEAGWAVVKLAPADQRDLILTSAGVSPEPGERGRKGVTLVQLPGVSEASAKRVLIAAWQHALAPQHPVAKTG